MKKNKFIISLSITLIILIGSVILTKTAVQSKPFYSYAQTLAAAAATDDPHHLFPTAAGTPQPTNPPRAWLPDIMNKAPTPYVCYYEEHFNDQFPAGWTTANMSIPQGFQAWGRGDLSWFEAFDGDTGSYYLSTYLSAGHVPPPYTITPEVNTWLISPVMFLKNGQVVIFWTRSMFEYDTWADRMQLVLSHDGASLYLGDYGTPGAHGVFDYKLLDINSDYKVFPDEARYPLYWTRFEVTVRGVNENGQYGRLAFRHFVEDGGPDGSRGFVVAVDAFQFDCNPGTTLYMTDTPTITPTPSKTPTATPTPTKTATGTATQLYNPYP